MLVSENGSASFNLDTGSLIMKNAEFKEGN